MITVSMEGVKDAVEIIKEIVVPSQRKYSERKANLENILRQAEIQKLNAQTLAEKAKTDRENALQELDKAQATLILSQVKKTEAEAKLILAQAEKAFAEAEKERESIRLERINLAAKIVEKYNPTISGADKINAIIKLLPDLERLMSSKIEMLE
jgi:hypothetical protein